MRLFLSSFILTILLCPAWADRIVLIYGDVLEGKVIAQTEQTVTIQGPYGERIMNKTDIREVISEGSATPLNPEVPSNVNPPAPPPPPPSAEFAPQELPDTPKGWPVDDLSVQQPPLQGQPMQAYAPAPTGPSTLGPNPTPYDIIRANAVMQAGWRDLEIAYTQRAFAYGKSTETKTIARIIPPNYMRAKMATGVPPSQQIPTGGEVEYDMYRAKGTLWQVAKVPGQQVQYLKMDASRIERQSAARSMESFQYGFAGTATDETLLQSFARNTTLVGSEMMEGKECWVLETRYTPEVIDSQIRRYPPDLQPVVRQQLTQTLGAIRNWIGKNDLIQWRMESFMPDGSSLLGMLVTTVKPNTGLDPQQLRMKVPKGTTWMDITDMVSGGVNQVMSGQPVTPNVQQGQAGMAQQPMMQQQQQPMAQQSYQPQAQPQWNPQAGVPQQQGAYQQTYIQQGQPGMPMQQQMQMPMQPMAQPQQQSNQGGGFLSRLFGGGQKQQQPQQPMMMPGGQNQSGNQTMMVPMVNGQPQYPVPPR